MSPEFRPRFPLSKVAFWAARYSYADPSEVEAMGRRAGRRGWYTRAEFMAVTTWKTPRAQPLCAMNSEVAVVQATRRALSTRNERERVNALTSLLGVALPTASVLLQFARPDSFPIIDYRALWSLGVDPPPKVYSFGFWWSYTEACRSIAAKAGVSMRTLDRALWQYSSENQPKRGGASAARIGPSPRPSSLTAGNSPWVREHGGHKEGVMGPVEQAIRAAFPRGEANLETLSHGAPFILTWDNKGIRVLLGMKQTPSRLSWGCLEGVPDHLRGQGWMPAGGMNDVRGQPGTLDAHLKGCVQTNTSRWVVRVLRDARVVEARTDPVEVRLTARFER